MELGNVFSKKRMVRTRWDIYVVLLTLAWFIFWWNVSSRGYHLGYYLSSSQYISLCLTFSFLIFDVFKLRIISFSQRRKCTLADFGYPVWILRFSWTQIRFIFFYLSIFNNERTLWGLFQKLINAYSQNSDVVAMYIWWNH